MTEATNGRTGNAGATLEPASPIQWKAWKNKVLPPTEQLAPRVWSLPIAIPNHPMRFNFCYAIVGSDEQIVLIDPGWPADESWDSLLAQLTAAGLSLESVVGVVATHAHPDHVGLAERVSHHTGAWTAMHRLELEVLNPHEKVNDPIENFRQAGVPAESSKNLLATLGSATRDLGATPSALSPRLLEDGDAIALAGTDLRVVWTPGHTPGSICVFDRANNILFTGDHVLPRVSPSVGMHPTPGRSPLADYFASLHRTAEFSSALVAPGHEYRFRALVPRLEELAAHHEARLDEIKAKVTEDPMSTLWHVASGISWSRGWDGIAGLMIFAALGETRAHLQVLTDRGVLTFEADDDGIGRYNVHLPAENVND